MAKPKKNFYAVAAGRQTGIFTTWEKCKAQVEGFSGAVYKGFPTKEEAQLFLKAGKPSRSCLNFDVNMTENEIHARYKDTKTAVAYVDGSYNEAIRTYGSGVVFMYKGKTELVSEAGDDGNMVTMRNVAGEIVAAQLAMQLAIAMGATKLILCYDYEGIACWAKGQWRATKDATKAYAEYCKSIKDELAVDFIKVKGHSGCELNELADRIAGEAIFCE